MQRRHHTLIVRVAVLVLAAALAGACSQRPSSQAVDSGSSGAPATPIASPSAVPPTEAPTSPPATPSAAPAASPPPPGIPDKPGDITYEEVDVEPLANGMTRYTYRIEWTAPEGVATSFTVVGVTECLRYAKAYDGKPCLVKGMRIPKGVQEVIAKVAGTERSVDIRWKQGELDLAPWPSILIRASNDAGDSIFAIVWSDTVCWRCTY